MDLGGYLRNDFSFKPGKLVINPCLRACSIVLNAGENNAACANATCSAGRTDPMAAPAVCSLIGSLNSHKPVLRFLDPISVVSSSYITSTLSAVNITSHPASHNCPMESNENWAKAGTICTIHASLGRPGISINASCVECIIVPLGFRIWSGGFAGFLFVTGSWMVPKVDVLPLSAIMTDVGVGGSEQVLLLEWLSIDALVHCLSDSPRLHPSGVVLVVARVRAVMIRLQPPNILSAVAAS